MVNYINKYLTLSDYEADETKQYPNVSYIAENDEVIFMESEPITGITGNAPSYGVYVGYDISSYTGNSYDTVYLLYNRNFESTSNKWYMLNNLEEYEPYGEFGSGRTITAYDGKLTIDDGYEYEYSGGSWTNVGQVTYSNGFEFTKYIDQNSGYDFYNKELPTTIKVLKSDVALLTTDLQVTFQGEYDSQTYSQEQLSLYIPQQDGTQGTYYASTSQGSYQGTITDDGTYYVCEMQGLDSFLCSQGAQYMDNVGINLIFQGIEMEFIGDSSYNNNNWYSGGTMSTSFKILASEVDNYIAQYGNFSLSIFGENGGYIGISEQSYSVNGQSGTVTNDGTYYIYSIDSPSEFTIVEYQFYSQYNTDKVTLIMERGTILPKLYAEKAVPEFTKLYSSESAMSESQDTFYGQFAVVGTDMFNAENASVYVFTENNVYEEYDNYKLLCLYSQGKANVKPFQNISYADANIDNADVMPWYIGNVVLTAAKIDDSGVVSGITGFNDSGLRTITIPDNIKEIGNQAFAGSYNLSACTIGSGVTEVKYRAFYDCTSLTSLEFPSSLIRISTGENFKNCTSLTSVIINRETPPTLASSNAFGNTNSCPIYVPTSAVDTYKGASNWSTYASRIQAIP